MKIHFKIENFKTDNIEFKHYNFQDNNNPLLPLFTEMTDLLNKKDFYFPFISKNDNQDIINISIKMTDKPELLNHYLDEQSFGCFCLKDGDSKFGKNQYAKNFNTIILIDLNTYKDIYKMYKKRNENSNEVTLQKSFLMSYLNTLTHEITHAIEFIENSDGLSPYEVNKIHKNKDSKISVEKCATGHGFDKYKNDFIHAKNKDDIYDLMEDRVEKKGRELLNSLPINSVLLDKAISDIHQKQIAKKFKM